MNRLLPLLVGIAGLILSARSVADEARLPPEGRPVLTLARGITIDRQVHTIPPSPERTTHAEDVRVIKALGFDFVKLVINPAVFRAEDGLDASRTWYLDQIVGYAVAEQLPVVVCVHPECKYKEAMVSDPEAFAHYLVFMEALARYLAERWTPQQLAFELMTEPPPVSPDPNAWNYWDKLQGRLWATVRGVMPGHTLILSGDMVASIEGLEHTTPVDDANVLYCFTTYEPYLFNCQGDPGCPIMHSLQGIPFPSGPETLAELPKILAGVPAQYQAEAKRRVEEYAAQCWTPEKVAARIAKLAAWRERYGNRPKLWCAEFGCHQGGPEADRARYVELMRSLFDRYQIGWSYWSFNEAYTVMTADRTPYGPAEAQTPDRAILHALMPDKYPQP